MIKYQTQFLKYFIMSKDMQKYYLDNNIILSDEQLLWIIQHSFAGINLKKWGLEKLISESKNSNVVDQASFIIKNNDNDKKYIYDNPYKYDILLLEILEDGVMNIVSKFKHVQKAISYLHHLNHRSGKYYMIALDDRDINDKNLSFGSYIILDNNILEYDISADCDHAKIVNSICDMHFYFPSPFKTGDIVSVIRYPVWNECIRKCTIKSQVEYFFGADDSDVGFWTDELDFPVSPFNIEYYRGK